MSQDVIQRITGLVKDFDARVQAAPSDAWGNQSPCNEWTARDVVAHVGNNLRRVAAGVQGQAPSQIGDDDDINEGWNQSLATFLDAINTGDLSQELPGPFGAMSAADMIGRIISADTLVHTWDLARAVGGDEQLNQDAVAGAFKGLQPIDAMIRGAGMFADKIEWADDADQQTQLLNFLGRQV